MPVTVEIADAKAGKEDLVRVFSYFNYVDEKFSTYKKNSEVNRINQGKIKVGNYSQDMKEVLALAERTREETNGYFDMNRNGKMDPSGLVKGWAIKNTAQILEKAGFKNFYVEAGGDIQVKGKNKHNKPWRIGIQNPFNAKESSTTT